jgi:hypothetical protein
LKELAWCFLSPDLFRSDDRTPEWVSIQPELKTERFGMASRLLFAYAFVRLESEQNSSHPTFPRAPQIEAKSQSHDLRRVLTKEEGMSDDRTKADKAWEARQEAARYRIFNAATNAAEATDEADDETYFAVLDQAGNAAEAAAAEITGYKTYADLLEALDTRRKQS